MSEIRLCEREGCHLPASTRKRGLEYQGRERELFSFARSVGITPDKWYGMKRNPESHRERS